MIDWHCHLLPGLDDGATSLDEAIEMAQLLAAAGFREICCTPHRLHGLYGLTTPQIKEAVAELQRQLDLRQISLRLHAGSEYYIDEYFFAELDDPLPLGGSRYLLLEIPGQGEPTRILGALQQVVNRGLVPLLAHPERAPLLTHGLALAPAKNWNARLAFWRPASGRQGKNIALPPLLLEMQQLGVRFQGNLGSLAGYYGDKVRLAAQTLAGQGVYHCFGSDAHRPTPLCRYLDKGMAIYQQQEQGRCAATLG